jgi:hypothetical protein
MKLYNILGENFMQLVFFVAFREYAEKRKI